jgi:hypothetical protein
MAHSCDDLSLRVTLDVYFQVQDMTDKGLSLQKDIAEKVRVQMQSPPEATAEQRRR